MFRLPRRHYSGSTCRLFCAFVENNPQIAKLPTLAPSMPFRMLSEDQTLQLCSRATALPYSPLPLSKLVTLACQVSPTITPLS